MGKRNFSKKIISWYQDNHRALPWRATKDSYRIWLSEVILQQTRVAQGLPYYKSFVKNFPTVKALAKAPEQKVLREWQGLGYYSRARNLHACAKKIVTDHKGKFPASYEGLLKLPGIGPYTAAAIASMSFDEPVAVVDGNVFRVLSRIFGMDNDIGSIEGKKIFTNVANDLMDRSQSGIFNQAVMEFGALHCTPRSPKCTDCPFSSECVAKQRSIQDLLPIKNNRVKTRNRYFTYFIFRKGKKIAMKKRQDKDIWSGLYDFHLIESKRNQKIERTLDGDKELSKLSKLAIVKPEEQVIKHVLTHQKISARFVLMTLPNSVKLNGLLKDSKLHFYSGREIKVLPKPILISRFLDEKGLLE